VPLETEAGALGAAMQAMYVSRVIAGEPESFAAIAERCVKVADEVMQPSAGAREGYVAARQRYDAAVGTMYGVGRASGEV